MNLREAAQMALEALEELQKTGDTQVFDMFDAPVVIPALRAALAEPEQKPVPLQAGGSMNRLTRAQAAIIGAYTGISCGPFGDVHSIIERVMGRPVFTHEMASKEIWDKVREKIKPEFLALCAIEQEEA